MHSGSAAVDVLNTSGWKTGDMPPVVAAYTASRGMGGSDKIQMQCIAYSTDGARTFTKFKGNPVLGESQMLAVGSDSTRDPKLFWFSPTRGRDPYAKDGHWVMVLFEGKSLNIYTSDNLRDWEKHGHIDGFHECPELFPLVVDGDPDDVRWIMYGGSGDYHIGTFDGSISTPETEKEDSDVSRRPLLRRPDLQQYRARPRRPAAADPGRLARRAARPALDPDRADAANHAAWPARVQTTSPTKSPIFAPAP